MRQILEYIENVTTNKDQRTKINNNFKDLYSKTQFSVTDFGEVQEGGVFDCAEAFNTAAEYSILNKVEILIPPGKYFVGSSIIAIGASAWAGCGGINEITEVICDSITLFTQGADTGVYKSSFKNIFFNDIGGSGILFDIGFKGGLVTGCKSDLFHTIFNRNIKAVTTITLNHFYAIKGFFANNNEIADSKISMNYISGYQPSNPTCFGAISLTTLQFEQNYVDFFKYFCYADRANFDTAYFRSNNFNGNTFDIIWRCFAYQMVATTIQGNTFTNIDESIIGVAPFFTNPDDEMLANVPYAFYCESDRPMTRLTCTGNTFLCNAFNIDVSIEGIQIAHNVYSEPDMNILTALKPTGDYVLSKIFVDFLDKLDVVSIPTDAWANPNETYWGREVVYNHKIIYFVPTDVLTNTGDWYDYMGNVVI